MRLSRRLAALLFALAGTAGHAVAAPVELTIINWEEFLSPQTIQAFEKKEGVKIREIHFDSVEAALRQAEANLGKADLLVGSMTVTERLKKKNQIQKLDRKALSNVRAALPQFQIDPDYVVPYLWGYTSLGWRADKVGAPVDTYPKLLEFARKNPGKAALADDPLEFSHAVLMMYGKAPYNFDDAAALQQALAKYNAEGRKLFRIQAPQYDKDNPFVTGAVLAGQVYSGDVSYMRSTFSTPLESANPKDGCLFWQENLMLLAKAPQPALALKFLNYVSEGRVAARNAEAQNTASGNPMAMQFYSSGFLNDPYIRPKLEGTAGCRVYKPQSPAVQKILETLKPYGLNR